MKFLLFLYLFSPLFLSAQDSWRVELNGKEMLRTSEENEQKNRIPAKASSLNNNHDFIIRYTEVKKRSGWVRTLAACDSNGTVLYQREGDLLRMKNKTLLPLSGGARILKFYTWALPTDPALKARIRIRRVHLCTLVLE